MADASSSPNSPQETYQVLARKYRPSTFEDMIGQDAMVTTLSNAFKTGRIAHAFMLTGVRGIGKTTTARLLARALNYETEDGLGEPTVDLSTPGIFCDRIMQGHHPDVFEVDAASNTGVDYIRELQNIIKSGTMEARFQVFIIDEVHMLSMNAFNALLKTLEEPPPFVKIIMATTEIRKIPITVLSRCQRFDLRRVEADVLAAHLKGISEKEGIQVSDDGLALIARAAEGSVRDGLSLLDQAIVQSGLSGEEVTADQVRTMLGLADRVRLIDLFEQAMGGDAKAALTAMRAQYDDGAAPEVVMSDLLDICHEVSRAQTLGEDAAFDFAPDQVERLRGLGERFSAGQLTRGWQILMSAHTEVRQAPVPLAAAEMALLKLALAGQMPPPEMAAQIIQQAQKLEAEGAPGLPDFVPDAPKAASLNPAPSQTASTHTSPSQTTPSQNTSSHAATMTAPKPVAPAAPTLRLETFEDYVEQIDDLRLRSDLERYVSVVSFDHGQADVHITEPRHNALVGRMVRTLKELTGDTWLVSPVDTPGALPLAEQRRNAKAERDAKDRSHPAFDHPLLKDAQLLEIRDRAPNVIPANFKSGDDT